VIFTDAILRNSIAKSAIWFNKARGNLSGRNVRNEEGKPLKFTTLKDKIGTYF
jgi:hypothetical protein